MASVQPLKAMNLDINQIETFIRFYKSIPPKSASTVRIFKHNDFFSVHEDDARLAAEVVFNNDIVKQMGLEKMNYLCLSQNNFDNFVRELLLVRQHMVEVYEKTNPSRVDSWKIEFKGSPGNLQQFETILFENDRLVTSNSTMALNLKGSKIGASSINVTEGEISVTEFTDNEFFTELEAIIAYVSPKECLIPSGSLKQLKVIEQLLKRNSVLVIPAKKEEYDESKVDQDLNRLLFFAENQQRNVQLLADRSLELAMSSTRVVINYLNLTSNAQNFNQFRLRKLDEKRNVNLNLSVLHSLNILPVAGKKYNQFDTVFGILNKCTTVQGTRLLNRWVKQPLRDVSILTDRLNAVEALLQDSESRSNLSAYRLRFPDLLLLAKKLSAKTATLEDCYKVYNALEGVPALIHTLQAMKNASIKALVTGPLVDCMEDLSRFQRMVEETMDLSLVDRGEYFIKPNHDPDLYDLSKRKEDLEVKLDKLRSKAIKDLNFDSKTMKLECNDQLGYFFRVTLKEEQELRNCNGYKIIDAIKGGVRFTNDKLLDLNSDYKEIKEMFLKQQQNVVDEIIEVASGYSDILKNLNIAIATADVLVSFATSALEAPIPYVRPKLLPMGSGVLRLKKARHPCLERQDDNFIANDVLFTTEDTLKIITGPNMGGKSTFIRTAGVCTYMAHIGCFVPCEEAEISIVDGIWTRIGAGDCEAKGLSTFMVEMIDASAFLQGATSNSFVVIDELGRGTSTYDGCGIAWAVAEHLAKDIKAFTLFATHFHEITRLAKEIPNVSNCHVSVFFLSDRITPLYAINPGACDKSYGIECAKLADFSDETLKASQIYLEELEWVKAITTIQHLQPETKLRTIDEGDAFLQEVIGKLKEDFKKNNWTREELNNELKNVKAELKRNENLFIQGLIN